MPSSSPILCLGTTPTVQHTMVFDRVAIDQVNRTADVRRAASGKPTNVARVLHTLGQPHRLIVPLGGDTGSFIRDDLATAGIQYLHVPTSLPTRTCVTMVDRSSGSATELVQEHEALAPSEVNAILDILRTQIASAKMLILSGSLAPGVSDDFYAQCCAIAAKASVATIVDATGSALQRALAAAPLIAKPNRHELSTVLNRPIEDEASLRRAMLDLRGQGPQWVIVTLGRDGAMITDGKSFWKIPALKIDALSPIGSGDAFTAGLASGIAAGQSFPEAARLATACAAANALVPGAGFLRIHDVRALEAQVTITKCS